jgi:hypothetical protein
LKVGTLDVHDADSEDGGQKWRKKQGTGLKVKRHHKNLILSPRQVFYKKSGKLIPGYRYRKSETSKHPSEILRTTALTDFSLLYQL